MKKKLEKQLSKEQKENINAMLSFNHFKRFAIVSTTTLVSIFIFAGIGYWLDMRFDKKPLFMVIGLLISFPITQLALYRRMQSFTTKEIERQKTKKN